MKEVSSNIKNISSIKYKEKAKEYWGPTPDEARKIMVSKPKGLRDKRTTLKEAVDKYIKDGINIGIGGFVNTRTPVATIHEIIRKGARDLTLSFQSISMCAELLAGAMIVDPDRVSIKRAEFSWWGYEIIGISPVLRYLTSNSMIETDDYTNYGASVRFKAAAMGIPFIPTRDHGGSDMELTNRGTLVECPYTGRNVYLLPACHPDVGLVHVTAADKNGNSRIFGALCTCPEIAMAATYTIVTAEKIISEDAIRNYPNLTEIPHAAVDALVEVPFGAHPGACYGFHWFDMEHIKMFRGAGEEFRKTGDKTKLKQYFDEYVFGCENHDDFLEKVTWKTLRKLRDMDGGQPIILT